MSLDDVPRMDPEAFRDGGYLQEVNRRVLHPLGLALALESDGTLSVLDDRDDPDGWLFVLGDAPDEVRERFRANAESVDEERIGRAARRRALMGQIVQPIDDAVTRRR